MRSVAVVWAVILLCGFQTGWPQTQPPDGGSGGGVVGGECVPDPEAAQRSFSLGESYRRAGELETARPHYEAAWRLDPSNTYFGAFLGWFLESLIRDYPSAAAAYADALRDGYGTSLFHFSYARALRETGDWAGAARHFNRSWELALEEEAAGSGEDPLRVDRAWFHRFEAGRALAVLGESDRARELMRQALPYAGDRYRDFMETEYGAFLFRQARLTAEAHDWAAAAGYFEELEGFVDLETLDDLSVLRRFPAYWYRIPYSRVARQMDELTRRIADTGQEPEVRLEFLCVYAFDDPMSTGIEPPIDLDELRRARNLAKDLVLLLTDGRVSIAYRDLFMPLLPEAVFFTDSTYLDENDSPYLTVAPGPTGRALLPRLSELGIDLAAVDSLLLFCEFPSRERGRPSSSVLHRVADQPLPEPRQRMGIVSFPYTLYYASEMVYLHEFFHLWENLYGVTPKHGFSPDRSYTENIRVHFPEWLGRGQYDYYRYHFERTFAADGFRGMRHP